MKMEKFKQRIKSQFEKTPKENRMQTSCKLLKGNKNYKQPKKKSKKKNKISLSLYELNSQGQK